MAALVPKPRVNLTRYHGVLAPNNRWRELVTPAKRGKGAKRLPNHVRLPFQDFIRNKIFTCRIRVNNALYECFRDQLISREELLCVLRQTIATVAKRGVVVARTNPGIQRNTVVVSLTYRARPQQEQDLDQVREYVRVFDRVMQRGVDRRELPKDTPIGQLRDVFFGTLEFSARTLKLRDRSYDHSVVMNLLSIMVGSTDAAGSSPKEKEPSNRDLMNTLKSIQRQLKEMSSM